MTKLKPCPFCSNRSHRPKLSERHRAYCPWCGLKTAWYSNANEAIDAWNTRPIEDALQTRIAELEKRIKELEREEK